MATTERVTIRAGHGKAARLSAGQSLKLINTHGAQVVDFWAFNAYDLREYMCVAGLEPASVARGRRRDGDQPATPDRHPGRGRHARHPRHDHGRLRPPALRSARLQGLSPQLPGQHVRGHAGAGGHAALLDPGIVERLHEHPDQGGSLHHRRQAYRVRARPVHRAARGDGLLHGVLGLPAGMSCRYTARAAESRGTATSRSSIEA